MLRGFTEPWQRTRLPHRETCRAYCLGSMNAHQARIFERELEALWEEAREAEIAEYGG